MQCSLHDTFLLQGFTSSLSLSLTSDCHPGYSLANSSMCTCITNHENILRCDEMNRYVYLRVSYTIAAFIDKIIMDLMHAVCMYKLVLELFYTVEIIAILFSVTTGGYLGRN